jgi:dTDP-glucose 4,6-dehydratase
LDEAEWQTQRNVLCSRISLVTYEEAEPFTTKVKHMDFSKAERDLKHNPKVAPKEGIRKTVKWMKGYYRIGK